MTGYLLSQSSYKDSIFAPIVLSRFSPKCDKIVLPCEYHSVEEFSKKNITIGTIDDSMTLFIDENVELKSTVIDTSAIDTSIYKITWGTKGVSDLTSGILSRLSQKPVVLILGLGKYSQISNIEIILNSILSKNKINIYQRFSSDFYLSDTSNGKTKNLLKDDSAKNVLDMSIIGIQLLDKKALLSHELYEIVYSLSPDYLILCLENEKTTFEQLNDICKYKFNLLPNAIHLSDYFGFGDNYYECPIFKRTNYNLFIRNEFANVSDSQLADFLSTSILNTITKIGKFAQII